MNTAREHDKAIVEVRSETGSIEEVMSISSTSSLAGSFTEFDNIEKYVESTMNEAD